MKKSNLANSSDVTVLIGGDVCPIGSNAPLFQGGDVSSIFGDLIDDFKSADLSIVNLECPVTDLASPITKCGIAIRADSSSFRGFIEAGIDVVNLANNHIMDHGPQGLQSTIGLCQQSQIGFVGAGDNLDMASGVLTREISGVRIGVVAAAEHEFSIAGQNSPGANPLDVIRLAQTIHQYRSRLDFLIVLLHAGQQHYPYPTPKQQQLCRFLIEEGAHAVICQHSHCPGSMESYQGGHIVYGQGNLIFDLGTNLPSTWYKGYLVRFSISTSGSVKMESIPYHQYRNKPGVRRLVSGEKQRFIAKVNELSDEVRDPASVAKLWHQFCITHKDRYFSVLRGHGKLLRYLNRRLHFGSKLYSRNALSSLFNYVICETHLEAITTMLSSEFHRTSDDIMSDITGSDSD